MLWLVNLIVTGSAAADDLAANGELFLLGFALVAAPIADLDLVANKAGPAWLLRSRQTLNFLSVVLLFIGAVLWIIFVIDSILDLPSITAAPYATTGGLLFLSVAIVTGSLSIQIAALLRDCHRHISGDPA
jgi:hypothetical protein